MTTYDTIQDIDRITGARVGRSPVLRVGHYALWGKLLLIRDVGQATGLAPNSALAATRALKNVGLLERAKNISSDTTQSRSWLIAKQEPLAEVLDVYNRYHLAALADTKATDPSELAQRGIRNVATAEGLPTDISLHAMGDVLHKHPIEITHLGIMSVVGAIGIAPDDLFRATPMNQISIEALPIIEGIR